MSDLKNTVYTIPDFDQQALKIEGKGLRSLLVITEADSYDTNEEITLKKLVTAIKFDFDNDIYFIKISKNELFSVSNLPLKYNEMIVFGLLPEQIGLNIEFRMYEILPFEHSRIMISDSIRQINAIPQNKQQLWVKLQEMFLK